MRLSKLSVFVLTLTAVGQFASAALDPSIIEGSTALGAREGELEQNANLPRGSSIGFPTTLSVEALEETIFSGMETDTDSLADDVDISNWTDEQVEAYYSPDLNLTEYWLKRFRNSPDLVAELGTLQFAHKGKSTSGAKMSALSCLAIAVEGEAGGEPTAGKAAVAQTIMSRAKGNAARVCSVVFARAQFEAMTKKKKKPSAETLRVSREALASGGKCGWDHFINKDLQRKLGRKMPKWVINFERRGCKSAKIGQHTFYSACSCN